MPGESSFMIRDSAAAKAFHRFPSLSIRDLYNIVDPRLFDGNVLDRFDI